MKDQPFEDDVIGIKIEYSEKDGIITQMKIATTNEKLTPTTLGILDMARGLVANKILSEFKHVTEKTHSDDTETVE